MTGSHAKLDGTSWLLLMGLAVLWSVSFIFMKVAVSDVPVLTLVLIRVALAALVLHAVVLARGRHYPSGGAMLVRYTAMGLFNNVLPFALIIYATARIGAGAASILNATAPIFALLIAHVVGGDRITPARLAGIAFGLCGVAVMTGLQPLAGLSGETLAVAAMLLATICYGVSANIGRLFHGIDPTVSAACQLTAASMLIAPVALIIDRPWTLAAPSLPAIMAAIALALASTALAYVIFFALISRAGGTNTMLVALLVPPGGVFFAWLILGEAVTFEEVAGMLLIGVGLIVIDGRALQRSRAFCNALTATRRPM